MHSQPLFFAPPEHEKVAGYKLPSNPKMWQSEIIRYLKSQHPYLPLDSAEIDIRRMEASKGSAVGSVILSKEIAIPIIIQRPRPGADPELSPMDVFFHKGKYRFLDPETIKQVTHKPQIGEPENTAQTRATGGNPYIGDTTGDATPLEYSGQASPFAGPFDGTKVSMDISQELLPEWMLKEATEMRERARERAAQGSVLFGLTGAMSGAAKGATTSGGGIKGRLARALVGAAKGGAGGSVLGGAAGAATPYVRKGLGIEDRQKQREREAFKRRLSRLSGEKQASIEPSFFTVGVDALVDNGHLTRLRKQAYLDPNDVTNFRQLLASNPHILQGSANNLQLVEIVSRRGGHPMATSGVKVKNPNMMQVYKKPDGSVCIKFSGGPETKTTPAELKAALGDRFPEVMSRLRSGNVFMEHDGVQQASWDATRPMSEAKPIVRDGLYSVHTKGGESIVGMIIRSIMDFDGKTLPMKMFVTPEGKYAISGEMFGVRLADKHRLPSQVPSSGQSGVFVNYVHGTPISTLPLRMISVRRFKPAEGDQRIVYMVQNPTTGARFALSPVPRIQGFERMHVVDPGIKTLTDGAPVYYMPGDSEWVVLREPVRVAENEAELEKLSSLLEDSVHVYYAAGGWHIDGTFTKEAILPQLASVGKAIGGAAKGVGSYVQKGVGQIGQIGQAPKAFGATVKRNYQTARAGGSGMLGAGYKAVKPYAPAAAVLGGAGLATYGAAKGVGSFMGGGKQAAWHDLDEPQARELLVGMGMTQPEAQSVMNAVYEKQGIESGVKLAGLHLPQIQGFEVIAAPEVEYDQSLYDFANSCRPGTNLVKAAADSGHPETLDSILSLEFITPQNLRYFIENIPDFEEATTRLAALLIAVRLGMPHVPEQPVKDALEGLSRTVNKLQILKSATDHKNERAANNAT